MKFTNLVRTMAISGCLVASSAFAETFQCTVELPTGTFKGMCMSNVDQSNDILLVTCEGEIIAYARGLDIVKENTCGKDYKGYKK